MGGMIRFSIITVCLNEAQNIRRTCESVCAQSCRDFEWLVIDGGSTDGTLDVLAEFAARIDHLVSEPDTGIYDAMNKGIRLARGDYLVFLNAGDLFADAGVLEAVLPCLGVDLVFGDLLCVSAAGEHSVRAFPDRLPRHFLLRHMLPHQASFFRRDLFAKYGEYDQSFRIAGDYELFARLIEKHGISTRHLPKVLGVFRTDGISSSRTQRALRRRENHRIRKRYFPWTVYGWDRIRLDVRFLLGGG